MRALALLLPVLIAACAAPPQAPADDLGDELASVTAGDGLTVTLRTGRGPCEAPAMLAVWVRGTSTGRGCWVASSDSPVVLVSFLDGDRGNIPVARLRKPERL